MYNTNLILHDPSLAYLWDIYPLCSLSYFSRAEAGSKGNLALD